MQTINNQPTLSTFNMNITASGVTSSGVVPTFTNPTAQPPAAQPTQSPTAQQQPATSLAQPSVAQQQQASAQQPATRTQQTQQQASAQQPATRTQQTQQQASAQQPATRTQQTQQQASAQQPATRTQQTQQTQQQQQTSRQQPDPPSQQGSNEEGWKIPMLAWWIGGVIVVLLVGIGLYCFWPRQSSVVGVAPTPVTANAEIEALKAKIKAMEAPRAKVVEEGAHPVQQYGVKTFNPTTVLGETNSRNVPTIVRTERHVAPNGVFYLLFGIDPILKKERMVTAGGATVTLLEPEWKCKRPKGELQLLENPPKGLEIPMGRYIVAVVE